MNPQAVTMLEFDKVKERIKEYAVSDQGKQMVEKMQPSANRETVRHNLQETTEAFSLLGAGSSVPLNSLTGISNIVDKLGKGGVLQPAEFCDIYDFLRAGKRLKKFMKDKEEIAPLVSRYAHSFQELNDLCQEIEAAIQKGQVDDKASNELSRLRKKIAVVEERIKQRLDSLLKSKEVRRYLQDNVIGRRDGRYVLPVKAEYRSCMRGTVVDSSASGSTVFIEPEEIRKLQGELAVLKIEEEKEVFRILALLTGLVEASQQEIVLNIEVMAQYDFAFAKGQVQQSLWWQARRLE